MINRLFFIMNPRIAALLGQGQPQGQSQGQPQGGPQGQEEEFSVEGFDGNPFESILASLKGGQPQGQPSPSQGPQQAPTAPQSALQGAQGQMPNVLDPKANQLNPGANPGMSKYLTGAVAQLQNFIAESTNKDEIMTARGIISLLSRLIQDEQTKKSEELTQPEQPVQ